MAFIIEILSMVSIIVVLSVVACYVTYIVLDGVIIGVVVPI